MVDDAAFSPGVTSITPAGGTYRATRDPLDDGDGGAVALTQKRGQYCTLEDASGNAVNITNNPVLANGYGIQVWPGYQTSPSGTGLIKTVPLRLNQLFVLPSTVGNSSFSLIGDTYSSQQFAVMAVSAIGGTLTSVTFSVEPSDSSGAAREAIPIERVGLGYSKKTHTIKNLATTGVVYFIVPFLTSGSSDTPRVNISAITLGAASAVQFIAFSSGTKPSIGLHEDQVSRLISAASTNLTTVKGSCGVVTGYQISNNTTSLRYVKLYDSTGATVGTTTPFETLMIPKEGQVSVSGLRLVMETGIQFATTTGIADSDATAVGANELSINIFYR